MALSLVSFNYKHTPLALREKLHVPPGRMASFLREVHEACGVKELMLFSTCNRVELYYSAEDPEAASRSITAWMKNAYAGWGEDLENCGVVLHDRAAVNHLFRVACSLESMVIGEPQILGQVKEGYQIAKDSRMTGPFLNHLMQKVFHAAKRVRSETGIARYPVSVSLMAVELASRIFDRLDDKQVMVIGAGEMAELVVAHLQRQGVRSLLITNRTFSAGVALAEKFNGSAVRFEQLEEHLAGADIVISSTGAQGYVVNKDIARTAHKARKGKPMFFIDIAVPRDIAPEVDSLSNVYRYDIDDLQSAATANLNEREAEAANAQRIIDAEVDRFQRDGNARQVVPVIRALRKHFSQTGDQELEKALERFGHLSQSDAAALRGLVRGLVNRLLHFPSTRLKEFSAEQDGQFHADALCDLFGLSPEAISAEAPGAPHEESPEDEREESEGENVVRLRLPGQS